MNKVAVITASTKGIGKAIAEKLLQQECFVFLNYYHDADAAKLLEAQLNEDHKGRFMIIKADVSTYDGLDHLVKTILNVRQSIDFLILNAGITARVPFRELTPEIWNKVMDANLNIPFFAAKEFGNYFNENGRIIFISSLLGQTPHAASIPYGVSKAGINALTKYLVKEFCDRRITCNAILPGFVDTDWQKDKASALRERIEGKIALKRFALPHEIADLCYDVIKNAYINGALINIDGGYSYK
jgi:3-oxoacyl-[acyl-carrier protein] reductase